jgi:hypothetical protein
MSRACPKSLEIFEDVPRRRGPVGAAIVRVISRRRNGIGMPVKFFARPDQIRLTDVPAVSVCPFKVKENPCLSEATR